MPPTQHSMSLNVGNEEGMTEVEGLIQSLLWWVLVKVNGHQYKLTYTKWSTSVYSFITPFLIIDLQIALAFVGILC